MLYFSWTTVLALIFCDDYGKVCIKIWRLIGAIRLKKRPPQNSKQSYQPLKSLADYDKMLYRIDEIINLVRTKSNAKNLEKMFNKDVLESEDCGKRELSYNYFKFIQLLKKEHSTEEIKKFVDKFYEEIGDEDSKEFMTILLLKFWGMVYGIVKDKLYSQSSMVVRRKQEDQEVSESILEVSITTYGSIWCVRVEIRMDPPAPV